MAQFKELIRSPHIHLAIATGFSIIVMAWFSKHVFTQPIGFLGTVIPPFLMTVYEIVRHSYPESRINVSWIWVVGIFVMTAGIIVWYWN